MPAYKARIYANGTITKYSNGEGTIVEIVATYNLSEEDANQVLAEVYAKRPDLATGGSA
ncbi:hypothetical protein [Paenibacillus harenae]|uniref:Uncharacterized protein n=1 Tax=Paenibacillus harenae TaxID=306543 RepID=A0ABT9U3Y4_PAEHA|nr:hypothetical protein [Paenibacillus harenae]MDQ0114345.1 hypothetical protein [Paenibacillus harenae]